MILMEMRNHYLLLGNIICLKYHKVIIRKFLEGSSSAFSANLTLIPSLRLSSIAMIYNGTSYSASASEYEANKYYVSRTHNIPLVNADVNITFLLECYFRNWVTNSNII